MRHYLNYLSCIILFLITGCSDAGDVPEIFDAFKVPVLVENATPFLSPIPKSKYVLYQGSDLEKKNYKEALKEALSLYSSKVLKSNLNFIVIAETIQSYDVDYGATYILQKPRSTGIYIAIPKHLSGNEIKRHVTEAFHHEFSSILMKNYKLPSNKWKSLNGADFSYSYNNGNGGLLALKNNKKPLITLYELQEQGIISHYGASSREEDFNAYAQQIMSNPKVFKMKYNNFPRVKKKAIVLRDFYLAIDPNFKTSLPFIELHDWK